MGWHQGNGVVGGLAHEESAIYNVRVRLYALAAGEPLKNFHQVVNGHICLLDGLSWQHGGS